MKPQFASRLALRTFALSLAVSLHAASVIKLEFATYEAKENEAAVVVGVLREGDNDPTVTVDYATTSLAASAGTDYTETTGTLSFSPDEKLKLVSIPILNDALKEHKETFRFTLSKASSINKLYDYSPSFGRME